MRFLANANFFRSQKQHKARTPCKHVSATYHDYQANKNSLATRGNFCAKNNLSSPLVFSALLAARTATLSSCTILLAPGWCTPAVCPGFTQSQIRFICKISNPLSKYIGNQGTVKSCSFVSENIHCVEKIVSKSKRLKI